MYTYQDAILICAAGDARKPGAQNRSGEQRSHHTHRRRADQLLEASGRSAYDAATRRHHDSHRRKVVTSPAAKSCCYGASALLMQSFSKYWCNFYSQKGKNCPFCWYKRKLVKFCTNKTQMTSYLVGNHGAALQRNLWLEQPPNHSPSSIRRWTWPEQTPSHSLIRYSHAIQPSVTRLLRHLSSVDAIVDDV